MKVIQRLTENEVYLIVVEGRPKTVRFIRGHYYGLEEDSAFRTSAANYTPYELPAPPATVKVKIHQLRGILREAEKLQATISTVAKGTMKVVFGDNAPFDISEEQAKELRASTLRKLGAELNALLTLKADVADETDAT